MTLLCQVFDIDGASLILCPLYFDHLTDLIIQQGNK